ncbi:MAG: IS3 family transposase [Lachnospiraceae bacterium]
MLPISDTINKKWGTDVSKFKYDTIEGFWGLMKHEMDYGKKYKTKEELIFAIEKYIDYYTNKRVQRNLGVLTPMEFHEQKLKNVA